MIRVLIKTILVFIWLIDYLIFASLFCSLNAWSLSTVYFDFGLPELGFHGWLLCTVCLLILLLLFIRRQVSNLSYFISTCSVPVTVVYGADSWVSQIPAETFASLGLNRVQVRVIDNAGRPHRINIFIENKLVILFRFCKTDPDPGSAFGAGLFADPDPYLLIMIRSKLNNITKKYFTNLLIYHMYFIQFIQLVEPWRFGNI